MSDDSQVDLTTKPDLKRVPTAYQLEALRTENREAVQQLANLGMGIDPALGLQITISTLIEFVCPEGSADRLMFDHALETAIRDFLKAALLQASSQKSKLIIAQAQTPADLKRVDL